jgi:BMFP domain-containing protein YqiC
VVKSSRLYSFTCIRTETALFQNQVFNKTVSKIGKNAMTSGSNRVLDELAKLVTDAAGAAQGVRREVETALRSQSERVLNTLDVVQREDFEAVREMAIKARAENAALLVKIEALEARLAKFEVDSTAKTAKTSASAAKSKDNS